MGCRYTNTQGCYSLTCCFCVEVDEACWWVGAVGVVLGAVGILVEFISANLPEQYCEGCPDHSLTAQLSLAAGCINTVQWVVSVVLLLGVRKENKWLLVPWLAWSVVSMAMVVAWVVVTLPYTPSIRGTLSLLQLGWGIHCFIVIITHYRRLALKILTPEEAPLLVPQNTPARRHKLRRRRLDPGCQSPIRVLLGAALRLHKEFQDVPQDHDEDESEDEEGMEMSVIVGCPGGEGRQGDPSCSRRRSRWTAGDDGGGVEERNIIIHTAERHARGRVEEHCPPHEEEDAGRSVVTSQGLYKVIPSGHNDSVAAPSSPRFSDSIN